VIARCQYGGTPQTGRLWMCCRICGPGSRRTPDDCLWHGPSSPRCFCDVRDSVEAILRLVATDKPWEKSLRGCDYEYDRNLVTALRSRPAALSPSWFVPYDRV